LTGFVTGELQPPDSTSVVNHLRQCERCSSRVRELESAAATDPLLGDLNRSSSPPPADPEYRAAVERILAVPPAGPPLPGVGDVLDDYRLVEVIGEGGMGVVYRAVHTRIDREVALKVIRRSRALDAQVASRFAREMKAAGKVRHANLVQATDAGVANGVEFLVMEYVAGTDLARLVLRDGPMPVPLACDYVRQAAIGLQHAHENGLIHRDVKPSNLILGDDGTIRVLDLGLALVHGEEPEPAPQPVAVFDTIPASDDTLTSPGQQLGTRDYTAPEQLLDSHRVDPRADVYGLGCTLVYLLTGRRYNPRESPPPVFPPELWAKFLSVDPANRFPTAEAAARALAPFCEHSRRTRRGFLAAAGAGVLGTLGLGTYFLTRPRQEALPGPGTPPLAPPEVAVAPPPRWVPPPGKAPMPDEEAGALQRHWAEYVGRPLNVTNSLGMELVLIPPGTYTLFEHYTVTLTRPYYLGKCEVTLGQYLQFIADNPGYLTEAERPVAPGSPKTVAYGAYLGPTGVRPKTKPPYHYRNPGWGEYEREQPVTYLTWTDVENFLTWLSAREMRVYRLPTQGEWFWALRAGNSTNFFWRGAGAPPHAHLAYDPPLPVRPQRVGLLKPNVWQLHDMAGNVAEMVYDYADSRRVVGHATDPVGPAPVPGGARLVCGGSYYTSLSQRETWLTSASCNLAYSTNGFRVLMEL
jgi:serine/threonine protein kinase